MAQQLHGYVTLLLIQYDKIKEQGYARLLECWPRFANYNHFEKFIILNLVVISLYLLSSFISSFSLRPLIKQATKLFFNLPPIKKKIVEDMEKARVDILKDYSEDMRPQVDKIPYKPLAITIGQESEKGILKGKTSGNRYALESHSKFVSNLSKHFAYSNPLHMDVFPLVKQMEIEVIAMTSEAIGLKDEQGKPCGTVNSGGTESIMMAIYAYRQYGIKNAGVYRPNLVICETGHPAAIKACEFFDIEIRLVPFDHNYQMSLSKMKSAIDENTICVYASYPNYPYGTIDDIETIGPYCKKRGVPVHLDMCLGGFVVPFIDKDWKVPEGVTTISADPHKYGLAAKGVSVLLYSSEKYRKHQFFVTTYWPGGLYGTPGVAGSRSGVFVASAWISMMKTGRKGYEQNAKFIYETLVMVSDELEKIGFQIFTRKKICVLSFVHKRIPMHAIFSFMKQKGWGLTILQKPLAFQFSFTPLSCTKREQLIKDMRECVDYYSKNAWSKKEVIEVAIYGVCTMVKDDGKKNFILGTMLDTFIDLC